MKKVNRFVKVGALGAVAFLALAGCSSETAPDDAAGDGAPSIWFIQSSSAPQIISAMEGLQSTADELGVDYEVSAVTSTGDVARQAQLVDDAIGAGADAIIAIPGNSEAMGPAITRANDAGVCTIALYNNFGETSQQEVFPGSKAYVGPSDPLIGEAIGTALATRLGSEGGGVAIVGVNPASTSTTMRIEAFTSALEEGSPNAEILDVQSSNLQPDRARAIAQNFIQTYGPDLDAIFAAVDSDATVVAGVVADSQYADSITVVSTGGTQQFLGDISAGRAYATVPFFPASDGAEAMRLATECANGDTEPVVAGSFDLPDMDPIRDQGFVVTADTIDLITPQY